MNHDGSSRRNRHRGRFVLDTKRGALEMIICLMLDLESQSTGGSSYSNELGFPPPKK